MKTENVNVNELIYNYFVLVPGTLNELISYYRPMVIKILIEKLGFFTSDPYRLSDYLNRADLLLIDCLNYFHEYQETTFTSFYRKSINNLAINIIRMKCRERKYTKDMIYLDSKVKEDSNTYMSEITGTSSTNVHEEVMTHLAYEKLFSLAKKEFSSLEMNILNLKYQQYTNVEISKILGISVRSVAYRLNKMKKFLFYACSK